MSFWIMSLTGSALDITPSRIEVAQADTAQAVTAPVPGEHLLDFFSVALQAIITFTTLRSATRFSWVSVMGLRGLRLGAALRR